jgi:hypothetical protein
VPRSQLSLSLEANPHMRPGRPRQGERGGVAPCMHSDRPTHIRTITSSHQPHAPAASYLGSRIQLTAFARNQHQRKRWTTRNEPALLQTQCTPRVLSVVHQHRCRDPGHLCTVRTLDTGRLNRDTGLAMPRASAVPHAAPRVGTLPTQPDSEEVSTPGFHGHWRPRDHSPPCTRPASSLNAAPRCAR